MLTEALRMPVVMALQHASLSSANLTNTIILATDLSNVQNLTQERLTGDNPPLLCNAPLPDAIAAVGRAN